MTCLCCRTVPLLGPADEPLCPLRPLLKDRPLPLSEEFPLPRPKPKS